MSVEIMKEVRPKLNLNTKGLCFFCLKEKDCAEQVTRAEDNESLLFSYGCIIRGLNLSHTKIYDLDITTPSTDILKKSDIMVPLCPDCSEVAARFSSLYNSLELMRMKLSFCVRTMLEVMQKAEFNRNSVTISGGNEVDDLVHAHVMDNLRTETMKKCKENIKFPQVNLGKSPSRGSGPVQPCQDRSSSGSRSSCDGSMPQPVVNNRKRLMDFGNDEVMSNSDIIKKRRETQSASTCKESLPRTGNKLLNVTVKKRVLKCSICGGDFLDSVSLQKHKSTHTKDTIDDLNFPCEMCNDVFKFYFIHRAHMLKAHPVEMFRDHVHVSNTSSDDIIRGLAFTLDKCKEPLGEGKNRCALCAREYNQISELENHVVVTHFDTVVMRLNKRIRERKSATDITTTIPPAPNQCNVVSSAQVENDDDNSDSDIEVITPPSPEYDKEISSPHSMALDPTTGLFVQN